jgi:hypothetical protein
MLVAILSLLLVLPWLAYYGWALATLWEWFVIPLGAPHIGWAQFVGLTLFLAVLRNRRTVRGKWKTEEVLGSLAFPAVAVLLGILLRGFM